MGNHDLWIPALPQPPEGEEGEEARKPEEGGEVDGGSVEKLVQIHRECEVCCISISTSLPNRILIVVVGFFRTEEKSLALKTGGRAAIPTRFRSLREEWA